MVVRKLDVASLYAALDAQRKARGLSWRRVAHEAGVSPSLFSRMAHDQRPDLDGFIAVIQWLDVEAETFMLAASKQSLRVSDLATDIGLLLRAQQDLDDADCKLVQDIIESTLRHIRAVRAAQDTR